MKREIILFVALNGVEGEVRVFVGRRPREEAVSLKRKHLWPTDCIMVLPKDLVKGGSIENEEV